ncbi:MAG: glycosyltransferase [Planctomycetota bacterium]
MLSERRTVLHVTNFQPWKDPQMPLRVLEQLRTRGHWSLRVLGDGPGAAAFDTAARNRGLASWIERTGAVDLSRERLADGAVLLSTSRRESFGLAALEALACGVPVVAPRLPGLDETLGDGPGAIQVTRPTPAAFALAVERGRYGDHRAGGRVLGERVDVRASALAYLAPLAVPGLAG